MDAHFKFLGQQQTHDHFPKLLREFHESESSSSSEFKSRFALDEETHGTLRRSFGVTAFLLGKPCGVAMYLGSDFWRHTDVVMLSGLCRVSQGSSSSLLRAIRTHLFAIALPSYGSEWEGLRSTYHVGYTARLVGRYCAQLCLVQLSAAEMNESSQSNGCEVEWPQGLSQRANL